MSNELIFVILLISALCFLVTTLHQRQKYMHKCFMKLSECYIELSNSHITKVKNLNDRIKELEK